MKRKHRAILVVSFGTRCTKELDMTIGAIEKTITAAFPEDSVYRAFTSRAVIGGLKECGGLEVDDVEKALDGAAEDGITELIVQPTHLLAGHDYLELRKMVKMNRAKFSRAAVGRPLLSSDGDLDAVIKAVTDRTAGLGGNETAICLMGHGTEADGNNVYTRMQGRMERGGYGSYYIGAMESGPSLEEVLQMLEGREYKKVVLLPLMVSAGHHARKEMAGDGRNSWKSVLESRGYEVRCVMEGLGQIPAIRDIYAAHARAAMQSDDGFDIFS